jgi:spore coat protein U-like protein
MDREIAVKNLLRALTLPALLILCQQANAAQSASNTFQVNATIQSACVVSASNLSFGNYSPSAGADVDNTSQVSVYCTLGTPYTLKLNVGSGGGTYGTRTLVSGASDTLNFNLFTSGARSTVWGDGTSSTGTVAGTGTGLLTADNKTVYGRLFQGQDKPAASYSSTVTVTVEYN